MHAQKDFFRPFSKLRADQGLHDYLYVGRSEAYIARFHQVSFLVE